MRPRTIEQLALVATTYRIAIEDGKPPVEAVAARFGITYEAARRRIHRARRTGQLAATKH